MVNSNAFSFVKRFKPNYFATFTTRYELTQLSARRMIEAYANKFKNNIFLFWTTEPYADKSGVHLHSLIRFNHPNQFEILKDNWQKVSKGGERYNRVHLSLLDKDRSYALNYCTKYMKKYANKYDWDIIVDNTVNKLVPYYLDN